MMDKDTEESDEVVFEEDVYLSKEMADKLYLFQYLTRNTSFLEKPEESTCLSAKIKPKQQKVEMEFGINIHGNSYDKGRGEQIAFNVDGRANDSESFFKSPFMDKYVISGSKAVISPENYAIALKRKGELHIVPIHSIMNLQPNFIHMDKMDSQMKKAQNPEEEEEEETAVAVTVRFEGANADKIKELREKSFAFYEQKSASEPWISLNYHPFGSNRSKLAYQNITCSQMYNQITDFMTPQDYLQTLVPECLRRSGHNSINQEEDGILNKPLSDQLKYLLINAHVLTFSMLVKKLTVNIDDASVERLLNQIAVLVRGCWAVKSELLYPDNYVSSYTGLGSKVLVNVRDYVLWLFTKSSFITRKEVLSVIHVPNEDFLSIITPLAVKTNRRWEFKFPLDNDFIESHPAVNERHNMKWDLRYKKLVKDLNIGILENEGFIGSPKVPHAAYSRTRQKRHSRSSQSEGDESGTDSAYGTKDFKSKRTCPPKKNTVCSPTKQGSKVKPCLFPSLDITPTFLESSPPADVMAELKEYVGDIMRTQYCMTFSEIKELVYSQSHLNNFVSRSDFEKLLEEALLDSGAQKLKNKWPQNTAPETLYAFAKFGNKLDRYRHALLDLFTTTARARQNLFVKKVEDELREIISESDCRILFEEYCVYKSGFYYLKGTIALDS